MAQKDLENDKLELSLFRRKRKKNRELDEEAPASEVDASPAQAEAPATGSTPDDPTATGAPAEAPTTRSAAAQPPATPAPAADAPTADSPHDDVAPAGAASGGNDTRVIPEAQEPAPAASARPARSTRGARVAPKRSRRTVQAPSWPAQVAVLVVGAVVGLAAVGLTFASLQLCELVTGTDSCGGPGLFVLLAVVLLMILGGSAALSALGVAEAGGISFLGVAMFVAICLVVLLPSLLEPWMIVVAPVLCALTFAVAHWVVTRFDEDILEADGPPPHDVR